MLPEKLHSVLYVPADNERALAKAKNIKVDGLIFDLEDAVEVGRREKARRDLMRYLSSFDPMGRYCLVRLSSAHDHAVDLVNFLHFEAISGFVLPKMESRRDILGLQAALEGTEKHIWAMVETAASLCHLPATLRDIASRNLKGLIVGSNDLLVRTGLDIQKDETLAKAVLAPLILAARAHDLVVLDGVYNNFKDEVGLARSCQLARSLAFDGKTLIHPAQIATANRIFAPTKAELDRAMAVIAAFEQLENMQKAVISLDGEMFERLHLEKAQRMVRQASY